MLGAHRTRAVGDGARRERARGRQEMGVRVRTGECQHRLHRKSEQREETEAGAAPEDPQTPLIEAHAGDPVRIHVLGAWSEQNGMFGVEGHEWPIEPYMQGADMISVVEFAGSETLDVFLRQGAGGPYKLVGDYVWSNQRLPYSQSGQWGYLRVLPANDTRIKPLSDASAGAQRAEAQPGVPVATPTSNTATAEVKPLQ